MTEPVSSLNEYSDVSSELEQPLSPVLSFSRINRRLIYGQRLNRPRSRIQLLQAYSEKSESCSANLSCSSTHSDQQSSQSSSAEERLKTLTQMERERKQCYNHICGSHGGDQKSSAKDFEFQKFSSGTSSQRGTSSTSNRNEASNWKDDDRRESSCVFIKQSPPSDESLNVLSVINEQSERCDLLDSTEKNLVQVKNQRLSKIPRLKKCTSPQINQSKVTCDFQSASGKNIAVSELDILSIKTIFSEENLNDLLKPESTKVAVRTGSDSNLILTEGSLNVSDKVQVPESTALHRNFCEFSYKTNLFHDDRYPAETRSSSIKSEAYCNASDSTEDTINPNLTSDGDASQNNFFNHVTDTQLVFAVDNALSAMEICSNDWGDCFSNIVKVDSNSGGEDVNSIITSQAQVDECDDFSSTSKDMVNVNIPPNIVECHMLYSKNLIELHHNKNFSGNSEESMHGAEMKRRTLRRKHVSMNCEGFCECEQQEAEDRLRNVIENVKKTEAQLYKHRKEKTGRKEVTARYVIDDEIQTEEEENVIEQEEHPNIAMSEKAVDKSTKRKKPKHHKSKDAVALEADLHTMKRMKRDFKEANADGNEAKKSKHEQKFVEVQEGEGLSLKPKKSGKSHRHRRVSDSKDCVTDNQVELSPNQKKVKIQIGSPAKVQINISCSSKSQSNKQQQLLIEKDEKKIEDTIKNTCEKSPSVSTNTLAHTRVDVTIENKLHNGESPIVESNAGHSKQLSPDYRPHDFNLRKEGACKQIGKPQKIHERETDHVDYDTQKKVPEKDPDLPKGELGIGFRSASGKQIKISADALKRAEHRFEEEGDTCLKQRKKIQTPKEEAVLPCGFTFASGKSIKLSEAAIKEAEKVYKEIENETNPLKASNNGKDYLSEKSKIPIGFKSASGKNVLISKSSLNSAQKLYENINLSMGDFEEPGQPNKEESMGDFEKTGQSNKEDSLGDLEKTGQFNMKDSTGDLEKPEQPDKEIHSSASKNAFELLKDVVLTVDSALKKVSDKNKKRLGVSRCKQIPISKDRLCQARLMFENVEGDTPNKSARVEYSTPKKNEVLQAKACIFPNPGLSPIAVGKVNEELSPFILHNRTEGSIEKWHDDISKQIAELRKKLDVLCERKIDLEIQKDSLHFGDKEHRRQRPGVLYMRKQVPEKRLLLKNLQWDEGDCTKLSETVLEMTPKNAEYLHFNYARLENKEDVCTQTCDGAMLIPNSMNLVGLSEIEMAFNTMAGVEPGLIPRGWIANHYRLIVWKLASYERAFSHHLKGALCVENIIQQLKYRYDREIDRAQRSALRKILEKDDVPQKRMVLCVSEIHRVDGNRFELQLTDGWYFLKTTIDDPLSRQVQQNKIRIGTKLVVQMAEVLNCEGCHPLQATDIVTLTIGYNCTRRAIWHAKLGYQRCPEPFTIPMKTIHPNGGTIACLKMYVARVYPLRYLEKIGNTKIWRNEKAEKQRAREFENEQLEKMEKIHYDVEKEYAKEIQLENALDNMKALSKAELQKITCPKTLFRLMESSNDPDSIMETLSTSQRIGVLESRQNVLLQRQQDISCRIAERVEKLRLTMRKVVPILKLLVLDANDKLERTYKFYIWNPTEDHLHMLREDSEFMAYNVTPKFNGDLFSNSKTHFKLEKSINSCHSKTKRKLYPLAMIQEPYYKPYFNEFDTVGLIVQVNKAENEHDFWLGDATGRILYVKIKDNPKVCCLLDGVTRGAIVSISNLIYCQPQKDCAQAIANQFTVISNYPRQKFLQDGIEAFKIQISKDLSKLLINCDKLIAKTRANGHPLKQARLTASSVQNFSDTFEAVCDSSEDNSAIPTRLTTTDIAMSLINTQEFY